MSVPSTVMTFYRLARSPCNRVHLYEDCSYITSNARASEVVTGRIVESRSVSYPSLKSLWWLKVKLDGPEQLQDKETCICAVCCAKHHAAGLLATPPLHPDFRPRYGNALMH